MSRADSSRNSNNGSSTNKRKSTYHSILETTHPEIESDPSSEGCSNTTTEEPPRSTTPLSVTSNEVIIRDESDDDNEKPTARDRMTTQDPPDRVLTRSKRPTSHNSITSNDDKESTLNSFGDDSDNDDESYHDATEAAPSRPSPPPLKKTKLPPSNDGAPTGTRRSARARTSTIVYVNGQPVRRENNYKLKGHSYVTLDADNRPPRERQPARRRRAPSTPKVRKVKSAEVERTAFNNLVKKRVQEKAALRRSFFAERLDVFSPFLEDKVIEKIRSSESVAFETSKVNMQPDSIRATMRDYQLIGLDFLVKMHSQNLGMILGDEMGLGKTLQTISLFCYLKEEEAVTGPSLVICPLSVLYSWVNELERWAPHLKVLRLHSSCMEERKAQTTAFVKASCHYDVVVTTYEMLKNPTCTSLWQRQYFNYLVLDEGHKIKNADSQVSVAARHIHCENRLILTGTPLQNNLVELWALLTFLFPEVFTSSAPFAEGFNTNSFHARVDTDVLNQARDVLELLMLRRMKDDVERGIPRKIETKVICPLSKTQLYWYKALLLKDLHVLARLAEANDTKAPCPAMCKKQLRSLVMQLRKCCNHPFLFPGGESDIDTTTLLDLIANSGKLSVLDMLLRSLFKKGHRVILFSQFTATLDIIDDYCREIGWKYCRFDGSTPRARRNFVVNNYNAPKSDKFLFLMSTRSGGVGLNLQTADTVILFDSDWNPQPDLQAMARVHRIGQTKVVHIYRLVSGGTVEERIVETAEKKLYLDKMVNQGHADADQLKKDEEPSTSELISSLQFGCNAVFGNDSSLNALPTAEDIDVITDRSRTEDFSSGNLKGGTTQTTETFDTTVREGYTTLNWRGVDFKALRQEYKDTEVAGRIGDIANSWNEEAKKRNRRKRITMVEGLGSGYGASMVPVLSSNQYDLDTGESSVFNRELKGQANACAFHKRHVKRAGVDFGQQDFCQSCGIKGSLGDGTFVFCPLCPVIIHKTCAGVTKQSELLSCSHHRCVTCGRNNTAAGGILFPCQACHISYCEDCLPQRKDVRVIGACDRYEELGFDSTAKFAYIHCSQQCETWAVRNLGWVKTENVRGTLPPKLDVSYNFGKEIDVASL